MKRFLSQLLASTLVFSISVFLLNLSYNRIFLLVIIILIFVNSISILITHKHKPKFYQIKAKYVLAPFIKAGMIQLFLYFILTLTIPLTYEYKKLGLISLLIYIFIEISIYWFFINSNKKKKKYFIEPKVFTNEEQCELIYDGYIPTIPEFKNDYLYEREIKELVKKSNYTRIKKDGTFLILNSFSEIERIKKNEKTDFVYVKPKINDVNDIDIFFSNIYKILKPGGLVLISYHSLENKEKELKNSNKGIFFYIKYILYFIKDRAIPKIPYLQKVHSVLTLGKNKVISKAEMWGRLSYCGFDVCSEIVKDISGLILAQKTKRPSLNPNPSYYPIIKLNRVGLYGKIIQIHKVRSMYPYSEFIQKKVFEMNLLSNTGKFHNDFRISSIGKIIRKYWIDELPQIIDWLRGEIKFVGIRAMSRHFFSLYPEEYKKLYLQVKPGNLSPIFDEKTDGFAEIVKIEQQYLESYLRSPVKTDIKYFYLTVRQILKGIKSS